MTDPAPPVPPPAPVEGHPPPEPPEVDITLEEWIAAGQACCGIELDTDEDEEPA